jgi:hypothetical protein
MDVAIISPLTLTNLRRTIALDQRLALVEVGWYEAERAHLGDATASLYAATNREVLEFKAMMQERQHPKRQN